MFTFTEMKTSPTESPRSEHFVEVSGRNHETYCTWCSFIESRQMQMGLLMLGDAPVRTVVERARLAETVGYGTVWLADERFYREVYSCLAHIAAHTSKVLLGPCVTDPFSRHPALTAMAIATLDEISGQRAILGIGAGISGFTELARDQSSPAGARNPRNDRSHPCFATGRKRRLSRRGHRVSSRPLEFRANSVCCSNLCRKQWPPRTTGRGSNCRWRHHGGLRLCLRSRSLRCGGCRRRRSSRARSEGRQENRSAEHLHRARGERSAQDCASPGRALARCRAAAVEDS